MTTSNAHEPLADPTRDFLRHVVAVIGYRGAKAVRAAPPEFASFAASETTRPPGRVLAHIGDLLDWAISIAKGAQQWHDSTPLEWDREVDRFFDGLRAFDDYLASDAPLAASAEQIFQGPLADALAHIGQLAMLRRLAGGAVKGENYFRADIVVGRIGLDQTAPRREFD